MLLRIKWREKREIGWNWRKYERKGYKCSFVLPRWREEKKREEMEKKGKENDGNRLKGETEMGVSESASRKEKKREEKRREKEKKKNEENGDQTITASMNFSKRNQSTPSFHLSKRYIE